jgi:DivIVA domain-containing protein
MDVSPKTLREVEFREKMRGYHPEDVDQFLERVAAAWEVLQDRLRQALERAQRAEQAATEAGGNDDSLRRTLLLAQRTADLAVQEGREQAARIVAGAEQQAQSLVGDAEQRVHSLVGDADRRAQAMLADAERRAQSMVGEAEQRARRGHEDALVEMRAETARLEVTRQRLQMDIDMMTRWVSEHRSQLRAALEDALTRAEQIDMNPPMAAGSAYSLDSQAAPAAAAPAEASASVGPPPFSPAPAGGGAPSWTPSPAASGSWAPPPPPSPPPSPAPPASAPVASAPSVWPRDDALASQPPEPDLMAPDDGGDADPYFAELRRAISDNDPLGPRSDGDSQGATGGRSAPGAEG